MNVLCCERLLLMITPGRQLKDDRRIAGVAVIEFAVILPLLILLVAFVTDLSLGILARTQVQNAARAGAEFATTFGYDTDGIKNAADLAVSNTIVPIGTANVTIAIQCACTDTGAIVAETDTAPNCSVTYCDGGAINSTAFATITVTSNYTPIFSSLWSLVNGSKAITISIVARTARAGA